MKIDLHCHTKKTKSGDPETRNVTKEVFIEKLVSALVSFVAITNHNHFDLKQYNEFSANEKGITVFPGIELDIIGTESHGHCLLITSPDNASVFDIFVKNLIGEKTADEYAISIKDFVVSIRDKDYIVIPHYGSKPKSLKDNDIQYLCENLGNIPVLLEPSNIRSAGIMIAHNKSTILGSDVKNWENYSDAKLPEMKISFSSYDQFLKLLRKDIPTIETFVKGKFAEDVIINPQLFPDCNIKLPIYNDVNVIFGGKGTGKTEVILAGIRKHFEDKGYSDVATYLPNDTDNVREFDSLRVTIPQEADLAKITPNNLESDFSTLNGYNTVPVTTTDQYYKWINSEKIKGQIFGFANSTFVESLQVLKDIFDSERTHYDKVKKAVEDISKVAGEPYIKPEQVRVLCEIFSELIENSWSKVVTSFCNFKSAMLTRWSIDKLKYLYQSKKGVIVKPTQTGFLSLFENSLRLYSATSKIKEAIELPAFVSKQPIGNLIDKGTIYREIEYSINPESYRGKETKHLNAQINKTNILTYKKSIDRLFDKVFCLSENKAVVDFKSVCGPWNINKLSDLLLCNTRIVDETNNPYDPSPGEKAMLLLNFKLMDDTKNVYILDEPEAKVGHRYINDVIIPRLLELSKRDKKIIVSTHDANIAVRTLPLLSVYREQYREDSKPKYRTYIGSPFLDKMRCYEDNSKEIDWVKTSMETLEGGEDAFIERGENYGR